MEERDKSMITDMFQGIIGDCITCQTCFKPKIRYETELILSLPLGDQAQLANRSFSRRLLNRPTGLGARNAFNASNARAVEQNLNRVSFDDMVHMDLEYIERQSLWLDIWILLQTPKAVIGGRGAG